MALKNIRATDGHREEERGQLAAHVVAPLLRLHGGRTGDSTAGADEEDEELLPGVQPWVQQQVAQEVAQLAHQAEEPVEGQEEPGRVATEPCLQGAHSELQQVDVSDERLSRASRL